jgi:hypothetical protein
MIGMSKIKPAHVRATVTRFMYKALLAGLAASTDRLHSSTHDTPRQWLVEGLDSGCCGPKCEDLSKQIIMHVNLHHTCSFASLLLAGGVRPWPRGRAGYARGRTRAGGVRPWARGRAGYARGWAFLASVIMRFSLLSRKNKVFINFPKAFFCSGNGWKPHFLEK